MATPTNLVAVIHDAIDEVTTTVERIHRSIVDFPLDALRGVAPIKGAVDEVRSVQDRSIGAVYDLVRRINREVQELTTGAPAR